MSSRTILPTPAASVILNNTPLVTLWILSKIGHGEVECLCRITFNTFGIATV
jgi:hypothetical protein